MRLTGLVDSAGGLVPYGHVCWAYHDRAEFLARAREYAVDGLRAGQWVEYVGSSDPEQLCAELAGIGEVQWAAAGAAGHLEVTTAADFYAFAGHDGVVDPDATLARIGAAAERALTAGYTGYRAVADNTAVATTGAQRAAFARFEYLADQVLAVAPVSALCAYDATRLGAEAVTELACLHPLASAGSTPFRLYADPELDMALAGEVDRASAGPLTRALEHAVAGVRENGSAADGAGRDIHLDLSGLGFVDVAATRTLARCAGRLEGRRLVLHGVGRVPRTTLRLSGWDRLDTLVLTESG